MGQREEDAGIRTLTLGAEPFITGTQSSGLTDTGISEDVGSGENHNGRDADPIGKPTGGSSPFSFAQPDSLLLACQRGASDKAEMWLAESGLSITEKIGSEAEKNRFLTSPMALQA